MVVLFVVIVIGVISICYIYLFNMFQTHIIRINEAENFIDTTLRKRFDLLNKSISTIKNVTKKEDVLEKVVKLKSRKVSNFELDRELYDAINEFTSYKDEFPELQTNDDFLRIEISLIESESEITAARKYYNDIITDYNDMVRKVPSSIVAKLSGYEEKTYFDGKDMSDDVINDFKF